MRELLGIRINIYMSIGTFLKTRKYWVFSCSEPAHADSDSIFMCMLGSCN